MEQSVQKRIQISNELLDNMLAGVKTQDDLWGHNGIITKLNKAILERILQSEMEFHLQDELLGRSKGNSRNGNTNKKVRGSFGEFELSTPRDRHSTFEPQIVPKRATRLDNLDNTILSLYAKGMTVRDIQQTLLDLYGVKVSPALISNVTNAVNEEVEQWRACPLDEVYPIVWLDGTVVKVHQDHQVLKKTIYLAL